MELLRYFKKTSLVPKCLIALILGAVPGAAADLVADVRAAAAQGDYQKASGYIEAHEKQRGQTPESILAVSWLGRSALGQGNYDLADRYAHDAYTRSEVELKTRALDREANLPLALGASLEVEAQVLAATGHRSEAVSMLESQLKKYRNTSIHARIRKNINLLSLEGHPAPLVNGVSLPKDKPVLEIGGGFATLARYALLRGYKDYTIIDLPFVSAVQAAFVADSFGEDSVCLYGEDRLARVRLIPSTDKAALAKSYNLVVNIDSLPEIGEAPKYLSMIAKTTPLFLSINQESSNARTGFTQNVVSEMCDAHGAFQRRSRHIYWMEQGYVEEVYAVGGAEI